MTEDLQQSTEDHGDSSTQAGYQSATDNPDGVLTSDQLALAAAVANDLIPPGLDVPAQTTSAHGTTAHPNINNNGAISSPDQHAPPAIDPLLGGTEDATPHRRALPPRKSPKSLVFHHIRPGIQPGATHAPYLHDFSIFADGEKTSGRTRTKFSENRRKEVQEIRKQGACIRCRMLKKPVIIKMFHLNLSSHS